MSPKGIENCDNDIRGTNGAIIVPKDIGMLRLLF